ncbi:hypothetical protein B0H17DRAFT_987669 [Mycena rosella]|uniref:DUF3752 domain-containing protein n=1 Tax=Mycena rosella TaxID=1033263 RepID=A0AAD7D4L7_MYCRO|nr:hypothetical protein B0H17DRAFT_987669 [Mycena rosella]
MSAIGPALPAHLLNDVDDASDDDEGPAVAGPALPPPTAAVAEDDDSEDDYAPALPPDMLTSSSKKPVAGPTMPPAYPPTYDRRAHYPADDDDDDDVGPRPLPAGVGFAERDAVSEFMAKEEKRRREVEEAAKPKAPKRDEWMLVPPTSSVLGNLDPTKLKPRQFARSAAPGRSTDNTLWTETPAERQQRLADEVVGKKRRAANAGDAVSAAEELEARKRQRVDEELRRGVEEHTRKTRGSALVDMHAKAGKGEDGADDRKGIWDRDRDMALSGRLMDDDKRNKMLKEAKGLGDRFGTGKTGGFY